MKFIVTTTPAVEAHRIVEYIGPIIVPMIGTGSVVKDWFAGVTDILGGKSQSYQKVLARFINEGVNEMILQARDYGANAIVNYRIETTNVDITAKSMISIINYGTAVVVEKTGEGARPEELS